MQLNPDCLRDTLLCVEENTGLRKYAQFIDIFLYEQTKDSFNEHIAIPEYQKVLLQTYSCDELIYHVRYCIEAKLIEESDMSNDIRIFVPDLTPAGHTFIANIRDTRQWSAVKKGLSAVRNFSISTIKAVAEGVTAASINAYFQK